MSRLRWAVLWFTIGCGDDATIHCATDRDCPATIPVCAPGANICTGCLTETPTCPVGQHCDPSLHRCVPGAAPCQTEYDCSDPTPVCDQTADGGICVECLSDHECLNKRPLLRCDLPTHQCAFGCHFDYECDGGVCNLSIEECVPLPLDMGTDA